MKLPGDIYRYMYPRILFVFLVFAFLSCQRSHLGLTSSGLKSHRLDFIAPECATYSYKAPLKSLSGSIALLSKPKDVYCDHLDIPNQERRFFQLREWIRDPDLEALSMSALTLSHPELREEICRASGRGVKVSLFFDSKHRFFLAHVKDGRLGCDGLTPEKSPQVYGRGHSGGIQYSHNKFWLFERKKGLATRLIVGSGNPSYAAELLFENWHYMEAAPKSPLAQWHLCLRDSLIHSAFGRDEYVSAMAECSNSINRIFPDIEFYSLPADQNLVKEILLSAISNAVEIDLAAHHFSATFLIAALKARLERGNVKVRAIFDDDMFWVGQGSWAHMEAQRPSRQLTAPVMRKWPYWYFNSPQETKFVQDLISVGLDVHYLETNRALYQVHHNKFIIFRMPDKSSFVFFGAGHFTNSAFSVHLENFYVLRARAGVEAFSKHFEYMWELGSASESLPNRDVEPEFIIRKE